MRDDKETKHLDEDSDELWDDVTDMRSGNPDRDPWDDTTEPRSGDPDRDSLDDVTDTHPANPDRDPWDEDTNDFFGDDPDQEPEASKQTKHKQPKRDPEDPDYWIEDEPEYPSFIKKPKKAWIWWSVAALVALIALVGAWVWTFEPYAEGSVKYGYIKSMEQHGSLVKTFEGVMIPYKELGDPNPTYFGEFPFSVDGDSLAARMKAMMLGCIPVRIEYETYHSPLFWKGAQPVVVVRADTADVGKILPPEYRYR